MTFKDIISNDIKEVFMNPDEFGEPHLVNGRTMNVIIDNNEMIEREKRLKINDDGLSVKQVLFYVAAEDFGKLPANGRIVSLDDLTYRVTDAVNEGGIYSISMEANVSHDKYRH